ETFAGAGAMLHERSYSRRGTINRWRLTMRIPTEERHRRRRPPRPRTLSQRLTALELAVSVLLAMLVAVAAPVVVIDRDIAMRPWAPALLGVLGGASLVLLLFLLVLQPQLRR